MSDYVAPLEQPRCDFLGAFCVTAGLGVQARAAVFEKELDDYRAILLKAIADRLVEAFAEYLHAQARQDWGYELSNSMTNEELIAGKYRGIRPAPGYPSQPDHTEKETLFRLLDAEVATGVTLTESFAMQPAASVCGLYFGHPEARYFAVGPIGRDQVQDYADRKGQSLTETERWLGPALGYDDDE